MSFLACQVHVERVFSVCGMLTTGRRNRMAKSLQMRIFLELMQYEHSGAVMFGNK